MEQIKTFSRIGKYFSEVPYRRERNDPVQDLVQEMSARLVDIPCRSSSTESVNAKRTQSMNQFPQAFPRRFHRPINVLLSVGEGDEAAFQS